MPDQVVPVRSVPVPTAPVAPEVAVPQESYEPFPAFQLSRFKRTLSVQFNEAFAASLLDLLRQHNTLPKWLYTFRQKLDQRLNDNYVPGGQRQVS